MAVAKITEYGKVILHGNSVIPAGEEPSITTQNITFTTAAVSNPFNSRTRLIRIKADARCYFRIGKPGETTAVATDTDIEAKCHEYFGVTPGYVISVYDGTS
ncbi:MAG: hypothetical protein ACR2RF_00310 [Geminicoccaceae bacterium]